MTIINKQLSESILQYVFSDYVNSKSTALGNICWSGELYEPEKEKPQKFIGSFDSTPLNVNSLKILKKNEYNFYSKFYSNMMALPTTNKENHLTQAQEDKIVEESIEAVDDFFFKLANNTLPSNILNKIQNLKEGRINIFFSEILTTPISWLENSPNSLNKYLDHFLKINNEPSIAEIYSKLLQPHFLTPKINVPLINSKTIVTQDEHRYNPLPQKNVNLEWAFLNEFINKISSTLNYNCLNSRDDKNVFIIKTAETIAKLQYKKKCNNSIVQQHSQEITSFFNKNAAQHYGLLFTDLHHKEQLPSLLLRTFLKNKQALETKLNNILKNETEPQSTGQNINADTKNKKNDASRQTNNAKDKNAKDKLAILQKNTDDLHFLTQFFLKYSTLQFTETPSEKNDTNDSFVNISLTTKNNNQLYYFGYKSLEHLKYEFLKTEHLNPTIIDCMPISFWIGILHHLTTNSKIYKNIHENVIKTINQKDSNLSKQISTQDFENLTLIFIINSAAQKQLKTFFKEKKHLNISIAIQTWNRFLSPVSPFNNFQYNIDEPKFKWLKNIIEKQFSEKNVTDFTKKINSDPSAIKQIIEQWCSDIQAKDLAKEVKHKSTSKQKSKLKTL